MRKLITALLLCALIPLSAAEAAEVTVAGFSPQGEVDAARPRIEVTFSGGVAAQDEIRRVLRGSASPLRFRPALPGTAVWESADRLVFTPDEDLRPATRYDADFGPGGLRTSSGALVAGAQSFSFYRPPLSFDSAQILNISPSRRLTLRLTFSSEVSPARLRGFLTLYDAAGQSVRYTPLGEVPAKEVLVETMPVHGQTVRLTVAAGLLPEQGDLPIGAQKEATLAISAVTAVTDSYATTGESGRGSIRMELNTSADIAKARGFIELSPAVPFTLRSNYDGFSIEGDFEPRSRVVLTIRKGFAGTGSEPMAEDFTKAFIFPDRPPSVRFPASGMFLTPAEAPRVAVETANVETLALSAWKLYGNNIAVAGLEGRHGEFKRWAKPLGTKKYRVGGMPNELTRRAADLSALGCEGEGIYLIEAKCDDPDSWGTASMVLCVTDTALSARQYKRGLQVWAQSVSGARPVAGAEIRVYSSGNQLLLSGMTDEDGAVSFSVPEGWDADSQPSLVTAEKDGALTFVTLGTSQLSGRDVDVSGAPWKDSYDGLWLMPRGLWQPGETLTAQAAVRTPAFELPGEFPLRWTFSGFGIELASGTLTLNRAGIGSVSIPIPEDAESGSYSLDLYVPGSNEAVAQRTVQVEEFRPPQVEARLSAPDALFPGTEAQFGLAARYLFGGSGAGLKWELRGTLVPEKYVSKNFPGYAFGTELAKDAGRWSGRIASGTFGTDGTSSAAWTPEADLKASSIIRAHLRLNVQEAGGRWTGATASVPLFPTKALIGVMIPASAVRPGLPAEIGLAAVDPADNPARLGEVAVEISKVTSRYVLVRDAGGSRMTWQEELSEPETDTVILNGRGKYVFTPKDEGEYLITFTHADGRASARVSVWEDWRGSASAGATMPDRVEMKSDREAYAAGSSARVAVKSPFPGRAVLTVGGDSPVMVMSFDMAGTEAEVEVPVSPAMLPNGWVAIQVVRPEGAGTNPPYRALGALPLKLDLSARRLNVAVSVPEKAEPGEFRARITVTDAEGRPANGTVSVAMVDRGIHLLSGSANENPYDYFTRRRAMDGRLCDVYDSLLPIEARGTALLHPAGGDDAESARLRLMANGDAMSPVRASDYTPLSFWFPDVEVRDGVAEVSAVIPEFAGTLNVEALAFAADACGRAEGQTSVARPVVVDLSLPRFAVPREDRFYPALNITSDQDGTAEIRLIPSGALAFCDGADELKFTAELKAGERFDASGFVSVPLAASEGERGALRAEVSQNGKTYAADAELAVRPGEPRVTVSGGGTVAEGVTEIQLPNSWYPGTAKLELTLAGAPVADAPALLETVSSWGSSLEQLISRGWVTLALPALLSDGEKDLSNPNENLAALNRVLAGLSSHQLYDGSWSRSRNGITDPWGSVAAVHLLTAVDQAGIAAPSGLSTGRQWLRRFMAEQVPEGDGTNSMDARAYGCYVLSLGGEAPLGWMNWLHERAGSLGESGLALLAGSYALAGEREAARAMLGAESAGGGEISLPAAAFRLLALDALEPGGADARNLAARISGELSKSAGRSNARDAGCVLAALSSFSGRAVAGSVKALLFDAQGNEVLAYAGDPAVWRGNEGGTMSLSAVGSGSLWYSWSAGGVPLERSEVRTDGVIAERAFIDPASKEAVTLNSAAFGQEVLMKITVRRTASAAALRVTAMLPGGFEVFGDVAAEGENLTIRTDLRFDRLIAVAEGEGPEFELLVPCRAVCRGTFLIPAVSVEALGNSGVGFCGGAETLTVK